jgi:hypothetical protein
MVCELEYMNMSPTPNYRACYGTVESYTSKMLCTLPVTTNRL